MARPGTTRDPARHHACKKCADSFKSPTSDDPQNGAMTTTVILAISFASQA